MNNKFLTVSEASVIAGVSTGSIYHHIKTSKKLPHVIDGDIMKVFQEDLLKLYPNTSEGRDQFSVPQPKLKPQSREDLIVEISNLIYKNTISGEMQTVEHLANALR